MAEYNEDERDIDSLLSQLINEAPKMSQQVSHRTTKQRKSSGKAMEYMQSFLNRYKLPDFESLPESLVCKIEFWDAFGMYLRQNAKLENGEPIMGDSATQYFSSVKNVLKSRFENNDFWDRLSVCQQFGVITTKLQKRLDVERIRLGLPISTHQKPMYREELIDCSHTLFSLGTSKSICDRSLVISNFKAAGRSGELATTDWPCIDVFKDFNCVHMDWDQLKVAKEKGLVIVADVNWKACWFNAMGCRWIVGGSATVDESRVFPELGFDNASTKFNNIFRSLDKASLDERFKDLRIKGLVGKSGRIGASNLVSVDPNCTLISVSQTGGWPLVPKNVGAWIDYERNLMITKLRSARVLGGWLDSSTNSPLPRFTWFDHSITISEDKIDSFIVDLFGMVGVEVLWGSIILMRLARIVFYRLIMDFKEMLAEFGKEHIIISSIIRVAKTYGLGTFQLSQWSDSIRMNFQLDAALILPHQYLDEDLKAISSIPLSSVSQEISFLHTEYGVLAKRISQFSEQNAQILVKMAEISTQNDSILKQNNQILSLLINRKADNSGKEEVCEDINNSRSVLLDNRDMEILSPFSAASNASKGKAPSMLQLNGMSKFPSDLTNLKSFYLKDVFVRWFEDDLGTRSVPDKKSRGARDDIRTVVCAMYEQASKSELEIGVRPDLKGISYQNWEKRLISLAELLQTRTMEKLEANRKSIEQKKEEDDDGQVKKKRKVSAWSPSVSANARRICKAAKLGLFQSSNSHIKLILLEQSGQDQHALN